MEEWNVQIHAYNCLWVFDISETQLVFPVLFWLFIQNGIILSFYVTPICWRWLWWDFLIHHSGVQVSSHKWGCVLMGTGHTRNTLVPPGYLCYYRQYYSNNEYNMDCLHAAGRMRRFESLWFLVWCSNLLKLTLDRGLSEGDEICMEISLIVTLLEIEKFSKVVKLVLEEQVCPLTDTLEVTF